MTSQKEINNKDQKSTNGVAPMDHSDLSSLPGHARSGNDSKRRGSLESVTSTGTAPFVIRSSDADAFLLEEPDPASFRRVIQEQKRLIAKQATDLAAANLAADLAATKGLGEGKVGAAMAAAEARAIAADQRAAMAEAAAAEAKTALGASLSRSAEVKVPLSRTAEIALKIEAATASALDDNIEFDDLNAAEATTRDAETLFRYLSVFNFTNPFIFGRIPVVASKVAIATDAKGKGVEARKLSRQIAVGRAVALQQKFIVWFNEWRAVCSEVAELNQRVVLLEANQELQLLKQELADAKREKVHEERLHEAACKAVVDKYVADSSARRAQEAAQTPAALKRTATSAGLADSRRASKQQRVDAKRQS